MDVAAAAAARRATVAAAVAAMGVAGAGAAREVPAKGAPVADVVGYTTILVALARAPAFPASSTGFTSNPGLAAARMSNGQCVG